METIWAPWRSAYVGKAQPRGCFLCEEPHSGDDEGRRILWRSRYCYAILNLYPYTNGHIMVVPFRHVGEVEDLLPEEILDVGQVTQLMVKALKCALNAQGINLGVNLGRVAGAGAPDHLHVHVVPRWQGDHNFMRTCANAKVISQSLDETYSLLKEALAVISQESLQRFATGRCTSGAFLDKGSGRW